MQDKQDKRRTFQEAQQSYQQVFDVYSSIEKNAPNYGTELKHVKQEVNEAYQQIQSALVTASEHQREQLKQFEQDIQAIVNEVNSEDY
ncbi:hypothetical protein QUF81_17465 [Peribacillus simplex]|jgi:hypothetical protein|uniref:Small, acid-soluble spore protein N n=1 Tax=Peribacillus simplex TaxID=1478 RepID=A0AAW7ICX2_9BACI|nr:MULTISPECIES: hypothetical protein [Peribacillus]SNT20248.1 hypothetical protein SAMN05444672_10923 [Bacillus sp. OK838]AMM92918.1 hypothetical protein UP17_10620 [Peribacillus simplex]MDF9761785.1 phenylalanyl-tRNA synthetase alpha subunit [Peribacillus simplex]MDM5212787.1 hypothetical protein [Peribacillus sp. NJ4]MDM5223170.1 hypothetical protein [Peribacillus sp. NJ11]